MNTSCRFAGAAGQERPKLIMGIDGGGTKSHLALFDLGGRCVGVSAHSTLNHEMLEDSYRQLEKELSVFIRKGLAAAGADVSDVVYGVFGIAGVDTRRQHEIISEIFRQIGIAHFTLCNDAYLGVAAGCPGGVGICAINGTGSTMAAIDHRGVTVQVAGIGGLSNDCGGSGWYGMQVLGAVYGELFKREQATLLSRMVFEKMGLTDKEEYIERLTRGIEEGTIYINDLNRFVFEAAAAGDAVAIRILERSADHYAGGIVYLAEELDFPSGQKIPITLAGSVFVKEQVKMLPQFIEDRVRARLQNHAVEFLSLETVPVAGAVFWAFLSAGAEADMGVICEELRRMNLS